VLPVGRGARRGFTAALFAFFFCVLALWALATPPWGSPDEIAHGYRAVSAAHGEIYVPPVAAQNGSGGYVDVPAGLEVNAHSAACYAFHADITADCLKAPTADETEVRVPSSAARYHPPYYLVVGFPTLFLSPTVELYAMRFVSVLLSAWMLAWAVSTVAWSRRPRLALGVWVLGLTPMVLFLGSVVNPNGLEITAAAAVWANAIALMRTDDPPVRKVALRRTAIAAAVMVVMRTISPFWLLLALGFAALVAVPGLRRRLWRRDVLPWAGLVAVAGVFSVVWTVVSQALLLGQLATPTHLSLLSRLDKAFQRQTSIWREYWGNFGWLDTPLHHVMVTRWLVAGFFALALMLLLSRWRARLGLVLLGVAVFGLPIVIEANDYNTAGPFWQERYSLPLAIGVVAVVAAELSHARALPRPAERALTVVGGVFAAFGAAFGLHALMIALHRYVVGYTKAFTLSGPWQPPGGAVSLAAGYGAVCAVALCVLWLLAARPAGVPALGRAAAAPSASPSIGEDPVPVQEEVAHGVDRGGH
jgi:hypothetical protein